MLRDQKDLLCAFNAENVEYVVVGGHAVNAYGVPRLTKDLDVFILNDKINSERVFRALQRFGAPIRGLSPSDFCDHAGEVFQIGVEPNRIDILQSISGVTFETAWAHRKVFEVDDGVNAPFLSVEDLIANKVESGRPQDIADVAHLRKMAKES